MAMGKPITVRYTSPGARPPVFVTASWTEPPWSVVEMDVTSDSSTGDDKFEKTFHNVRAGEHQYKFRLGTGDWWVVDESVETAFDSYGNRNNVLKVAPSITAEHSPPIQEHENAAPSVHPFEHIYGNNGSLPEDEDEGLAEELNTSSGAELEDAAPLLRHETILAPPHTKTAKTVAFSTEDDDDKPAPLFRHETTRFGAADQQLPSKPVTPDEEDEGDVEDDDDAPGPLLHHETTYYDSNSPRRTFETEIIDSNEDEESAPLFRHETIRSRSTTTDLQGDEDVDEDIAEEDEPAPLFRHETKYDSARPDQNGSSEGSTYVHDSDDEDEPAPLLRHETIFPKDLTKTYEAQEHSDDDDEPAPLLRHETIFAKNPKEHHLAKEDSDDDNDVVPLFRHETIRADHHIAKSNTWQDDDDEPTPLLRHESIYVHSHHGNVSDTAVSESFTDRSPVFRGRMTPPYHERSPSGLSGSRSLTQLSDLYPSSLEHAIASDDTLSLSPLRRGPGSRSATSLDVPSPSSLDPIAEASPSLERPDPMDKRSDARSVSASLDGIVTLPTTMSLPSIRPDLKKSSYRQDSVVDSPTYDLPEPAGPTVRISKPDLHALAPIASPTQTNDENMIGSEVSIIRQRRASPSSATSKKSANTRGEIADTRPKNKNIVKVLWGAMLDNLFGPIGRWLAHICGGKRNATVVILSLVSVAAVTLAIYYLPR